MRQYRDEFVLYVKIADNFKLVCKWNERLLFYKNSLRCVCVCEINRFRAENKQQMQIFFTLSKSIDNFQFDRTILFFP